MCSNQVIGVLGGGQLGRMLVESANRLNIRTTILDAEGSPAKQINGQDKHINGSFKDHKAVQQLAKQCDILTPEIEHVDTYALEEVQSQVKIEPSWQTIRTIQDKFQQKCHLEKFNIPMPEHVELQENTIEGLKVAGEKLGLPFMLKSKTGAYDGRGNVAVRSASDFASALETLKDRPLYAEKWADFRTELAVVVVRTKDKLLSFPTCETIQEDSICKLVYAPPRLVSESVQRNAQDLARKAVAAFDGKGCYGVEMFLLEDDSLLLCEIASRVHNSGHYTIEGCAMSQFDAHIRAILDLPIPEESLELRDPAIMLNVLGGLEPLSHLKLAEAALSIPNANVHLYGKGDGKLGRKMGHITVTRRTLYDAERAIEPLIQLSQILRNSEPKPNGLESTLISHKGSGKLVGVIMGSDSDLKTLVPGLRLLKDYFNIEHEVNITSAHRTPEYMASYASSAARRGMKVIIAAAGGAAHLPGMAAAYTSLPVIGVPVKGSALDGVDSLHSIVQMPRGVPVAAVGINNSINAALLTARILGAYDTEVMKKVESYARDAKIENLEVKDSTLREIGWEAYYERMAKT